METEKDERREVDEGQEEIHRLCAGDDRRSSRGNSSVPKIW